MIERQRELLKFLARHGQWFTGRELAAYFSVSDRTIRSDVTRINAQAPVASIIADTQRGYRAVGVDGNGETDSTATSSRGRLLAEVYELVRAGTFDVYGMAARLQVSDATVEADLQALRRQVAVLGFDQVVVARHGPDAVLHGSDTYSNNLVYELGRLLYNDFNAATVSFIGAGLGVDVDGAVRALDGFLAARRLPARFLRSLELVLDYLVLADGRSPTAGPHGPEGSERAQGADELADRLVVLLATATRLRLDGPSELAFRRKLDLRRRITEDRPSRTASHGDIRSFYRERSGLLVATYQVDLLQDADLFEALVSHTAMALGRIRLGYKYLNPVKKQILEQYPYVVDAARFVAAELEARFAVPINADELSFFVVYLAVMLRPRIEERVADMRVRVVVIDMESRAGLRLTSEYLRRQSDGVDLVVVEVHTYLELERALEVPEFFDLIVSCGDTAPATGRPTVQLSTALSEMDRRLLRGALAEARRQVRRRAFSRFFRPLLRSDGFLQLTVDTPQAAIQSLAALAVSLDLADDRFLDAVMAREQYLSTSLASGFALPHALDHDARASALLIGVSERRIRWGDHTVSVVVLLVSARRDEAVLPFVTGVLSEVLSAERTGESLRGLTSLADVESFLLDRFLE